MDPSRIRLEDDRFGLIGASFRPENRATFVGRESDDLVWSIGIAVSDDDEIQTVEIDEHGAKSSRMLTPGETFEGLEILATSGNESYLIVGTLTLLGMDLRSTNAETAHEFAEVLRSAADDLTWRLPLHLIGQPRDLQLSAQGRDILRQTADSLEREGHARTSLSAARRLELSATALDAVRRRIARKSLQAYRMHGRWYVVLDNLARSRPADQNGTSTATVPAATMTTEPGPIPFMEAEAPPVEVTEAEQVAESVVEEEPFLPESEVEQGPVAAEPLLTEEAENVPEQVASELEAEESLQGVEPSSEAPTQDELEAFVTGEPETAAESASEAMLATQPPEEPTASEPAAEESLVESIQASAGEESHPVQPESVTAETPTTEEAETVADHDEQVTEEPIEERFETRVAASAEPSDQLISEVAFEQFIEADIDTLVREEAAGPDSGTETEPDPEERVAQPEEFVAESTTAEPQALEIPVEEPGTQTDTEPEPEVSAAEATESHVSELSPADTGSEAMASPEESVVEEATIPVSAEAPSAEGPAAERADVAAELDQADATIPEEAAYLAADESETVGEPENVQQIEDGETSIDTGVASHLEQVAEPGEAFPEAAAIESREAAADVQTAAETEVPEEPVAQAEPTEFEAEVTDQLPATGSTGVDEAEPALQEAAPSREAEVEELPLAEEASVERTSELPEPAIGEMETAEEPSSEEVATQNQEEPVAAESEEQLIAEETAPEGETGEIAGPADEAGEDVVAEEISVGAELSLQSEQQASLEETAEAETSDQGTGLGADEEAEELTAEDVSSAEGESVEATASEQAYEEAEAEETEEEPAGAATPPRFIEADVTLLNHLRDEVAFLREQGQEKDRQIVAWINGGQWLQPFVDQIRSLEQQVEHLGVLQAKRDGDRIADLMTERDRLREQLGQLETEIESERAAREAAVNSRRSWFRRMMS